MIKKVYFFLSFFVLMNLCSLSAQDVNLAWHYFKNEAYTAASESFLKVVEKDKEIIKALGDCYYLTGDVQNATKWYEKFIALHSEAITYELLFRYSQALYGVGSTNKANLWFKRYLDLNSAQNKELSLIEKNYDTLNISNKGWEIYRLTTNTENSEFGGSFYQHTKFVFAASSKKGAVYVWNEEPYLDLYEAAIDQNGFFTDIKPFSKNINSKWHEANAVFTRDGKTAYFTSNNTFEGKKKFKTNKYLNILKANKVNGIWGNITSLPINVEGYITEHPALNEDETKLYFSSDRPGGFGSLDLYVVAINEDGTFGKPKNLGSEINTYRREQFPFIGNDTLYFASDGYLGLGGLDIYKSYVQNNTYSSPVNLGRGINSKMDDFAFVKNDSLNIGYVSSNRDGNDDIFLIEKVVEQYAIKVELRDRINNNLIDNTVVQLFLEDKEIIEKIASGGVHTFTVAAKVKGDYKIRVQHEFYQPAIANLTPTQIKGKEKVVIFLDGYVEVEKEIIKRNNKIQIDHAPIYFDVNSSYLDSKAKNSLKHIVEILNKYPDMYVRCESHTDARATDVYNNWLSEKRAERTADYIISNGIDAVRVSWKGFGETEILNKCVYGFKCTDEEHGVNRRTEFVLIAKPR